MILKIVLQKLWNWFVYLQFVDPHCLINFHLGSDLRMPRFTKEQYTRWKEVIRKAGEASRYYKDSDSDSLPDPELYEPEVWNILFVKILYNIILEYVFHLPQG